MSIKKKITKKVSSSKAKTLRKASQKRVVKKVMLSSTNGTIKDVKSKRISSKHKDDDKIGVLAKNGIYAALAEGRVPDSDFTELQSLAGTRRILGASLTTCPLFSLSPMIRRDGRNGCWTNPARRNGQDVYVNSQWYKEHLGKLKNLLKRWEVKSKVRDSVSESPNESDPNETKSEYVFELASEVVSGIAKLVIKKWKSGGIEASLHALKQAQSIHWCVDTLSIRYPLLKQLRVFESEADYAATFRPLGVDYPRVLICKNHVGLDVKEFFLWARSAGVSAKEIEDIYRIWRQPTDGVCSDAKTLIPEDQPPSKDMSIEQVKPVVSLSQLRAERKARQRIQAEEKSKVEATISKKKDAAFAGVFNEVLKQHPGCSVQDLLQHLSDVGCNINLKTLKEYPKLVVLADACHSADLIDGLEEAGVVLEKALDDLFVRGGGYTSAHELFVVVQIGLDDFFYNNDDFNTEREIYDLASYFFEKLKFHGRNYLFYNNTHIWRERPDYELADFGLLVHWARMNGGIMTKELGYEKFRARGSTTDSQVSCTFSQAITKALDKSKFWILDEDVYLLKEGHEITSQIIFNLKRLLDELLSIELNDPGVDFIPMGDISDDFFAELPPLADNQKWTPYILQSVISDYSSVLGYKTLPRANIREQHAAILPDISEYVDYSDLVRAMVKVVYRQPSKEFYIYDLHKFLQERGLWPAEVGCSSFLKTALKKNINFQFIDEYNLVVV